MLRPYADHKLFHWGFHIGMHTSDLVLANRGGIPEGEPFAGSALYGGQTHFSPGFSVGVVADYSPRLWLSLRFLPTLHFGENRLAFTDMAEAAESFTLKRNIVELPLLVKLSSRRFNNTRPYIIAGPYAALQVGQRKDAPLAFNLIDAGISCGVGCDIYLRYFKLAPELRLSWGLTDMLRHSRPEFDQDNRLIYTQSLKNIQGRMILLTFNFE